MSAEEIATRTGRQLRFGAERLGIVGRAVPPRPTWPPHADDAFAGVDVAPDVAQRVIEAADAVLSGRFEFFGRRFDLGFPPAWNVDPLTRTTAPLAFGKTLDYRDARVVGDAKHVWELNRHLEIVWLAQAYRLRGDARYLDGIVRLVDSWIDQCPYLRGPNWCSSLELGIRLINWHLAYRIAGGAGSPLFDGAAGERFRDRWLESIYRHCYFVMHHLSTYPSSANNHLIGELAGVVVATCMWPCWPIFDAWRSKAIAGLHREIRRQTYVDGVNKEQTTAYQQFVASLFIVAGLAARRAGIPLERDYWALVERMIEFVFAIMDAGGHVPMIGDADDGLAFALEPRTSLDPFGALLAVGARLFDDPAWRERSQRSASTADWLCADVEPIGARSRARRPVTGARAGGGGAGLRAAAAASAVNTETDALPAAIAVAEPRRAFPHGGYYVLGRSFGAADEVRAVFDAGPLGFLSIAAHGHADCLSMTLSVAGREQLVDPGTYVYHAEREWRDYFRGTAAHNTVRVDGLDQSRIGGQFLWLEKAEAHLERFESTDDHDEIAASHDGYERLPDPVRHERRVRFCKRTDVFEIVDRLVCAREHVVERYWHFAEHCRVALDAGSALSDDGQVRLRIDVDDVGTDASLLHGSTAPIGGWVSRRFRHKSPSATLVYRTRISGVTTLRTRIAIERS
ncbi:MAG TPA: alginate lyase family protein [Gammaproteobacteria bacterium]